jgi:hypothetical protein
MAGIMPIIFMFIIFLLYNLGYLGYIFETNNLVSHSWHGGRKPIKPCYYTNIGYYSSDCTWAGWQALFMIFVGPMTALAVLTVIATAIYGCYTLYFCFVGEVEEIKTVLQKAEV